MKNIIYTLVALILFQHQLYAEGAAPDITISGTINGIVTTFIKGIEVPVSGREVTIIYDKNKKKTAKTNDDGVFYIQIKGNDRLPLGRKIKFKISGQDSFILSPYNGEMFPPKELTLSGYELKLVVVSNGSQLQAGPLRASFISRDISNQNKKQRYSVQILSTIDPKKALKIRNEFRNMGYDSFIIHETKENGLVVHNVYSSSFVTFKDANKVKNKIRRLYKKKYKDAFVKLILY